MTDAQAHGVRSSRASTGNSSSAMALIIAFSPDFEPAAAGRGSIDLGLTLKQETQMDTDEGLDRRCREQLTSFRKRLEELESGQLAIGSRTLGNDWVDITPEVIERVKRYIATYEAILARHD